MKTKRILSTLPILLGLASSGFGQINLSIGDLPAGKAIIITHSVTVDPHTLDIALSSQATLSGSNFAALPSDDPDTTDPSDPTRTPIQQPASLADLSKEVTEDIVAIFAASEFDSGFSDLNTGDMLQVLQITALPLKGLLRLGSTEIVSVPANIPRASIETLSYHPALNETGSDAFAWNASDGTVFSEAAALVNLMLNAVNDPPQSLADTVFRQATQSLKIPTASLLANDTDVENNLPLSLVSVSYTGGNGASVQLSGDTVFYNPNAHTGVDSFSYTVQDSLGASSLITVTVSLLEDDSITINSEITPLAGGDIKIIFAGIPGRTYEVQSSDSLVPANWVNRDTLTADAQGRFEFIDTGVLPPQRVYRTIAP